MGYFHSLPSRTGQSNKKRAQYDSQVFNRSVSRTLKNVFIKFLSFNNKIVPEEDCIIIISVLPYNSRSSDFQKGECIILVIMYNSRTFDFIS